MRRHCKGGQWERWGNTSNSCLPSDSEPNDEMLLQDSCTGGHQGHTNDTQGSAQTLDPPALCTLILALVIVLILFF